ncbi:hypothetical protein QTG54_012444 [Skeletonema marinoi]|uniref:Uncharacterized protein n=1 Tax=Skeletonema marinoi TaxID=267567 RepID=A0AAD8Y0J4_9STRA|nr:hypothetical protein QTG54_012444 [Skeletonema marinoi]
MTEQRGDYIGSYGGARRRMSAFGTSIATDASLLLASLEQAPVEDEAEAALIEVLERRQVTFDGNLPTSTPHGVCGHLMSCPHLITF